MDRIGLNDLAVNIHVALRLIAALCGFCGLLFMVGCSADPADGMRSLHSEKLSFRVTQCLPSSMTLMDVTAVENRGLFSEDSRQWFETESGCPTIWLAFDPVNRAGVIDFGTLVDKITLYLADRQSGALIWQSSAGDQLPATERELRIAHIAFPLSQETLRGDIYARIEHMNQLHIQPRFLERQEAERRENDALIVHSWIIGASCIMALFNLCLGLALRKGLFIYYSFFVASLVLSNLVYTNLGAAYVWPDQAQASNLAREIAMVGNLVFAGMMYTAFLEGSHANRTVRLGVLLPALLILPISVTWWLMEQWRAHVIIAAWMGIAISSFIVTIVILTLRRLGPPRLLLPPLFLICLPVFLSVVVPKNSPDELAIGLFSIRYILPVDHYFEVIMLVDALLFSLLFAYRIRIVESEALKVSNDMRSLQQSISQKIIKTIDNERKRIAADLHDTAGQGLLAISAKLTHFTRDDTLSSKQIAAIEQTADYSRGVINDIRRISHDLHPAILDHVGWGAAIEELYENLSANTDIHAQVEIEVTDEILNDLQKINLFRITQEIVSNAGKHASSTEHSARFFVADGSLTAEFGHNSEFDIARSNGRDSHSLGYSIIDQRVRSLGGKWQKSDKEGQSIITIEIPICGDSPEPAL